MTQQGRGTRVGVDRVSTVIEGEHATVRREAGMEVVGIAVGDLEHQPVLHADAEDLFHPELVGVEEEAP